MKKKSIRRLTIIAILSSVAAALMYLEIPIPFLVYKIDFSDVAALIGAFAYGPLAGIVIELVKNVAHLPIGFANGTMGIGELANFLVGAIFVIPAGIIYHKHKTKKSAMIGLGISIVVVTISSVILNAFVFLPIYAHLVFNTTIDGIISYYTPSFPIIKNVFTFLIFGTVPFNVVKFLIVSLIVILIYKRVSHLIKAKDRENT